MARNMCASVQGIPPFKQTRNRLMREYKEYGKNTCENSRKETISMEDAMRPEERYLTEQLNTYEDAAAGSVPSVGV
jgi:hypothetical protein